MYESRLVVTWPQNCLLNDPSVGNYNLRAEKGRGGGLVVSMLACETDDPRSNHAEAYSFFCKMCGKTTIYKKRLANLKKINHFLPRSNSY